MNISQCIPLIILVYKKNNKSHTKKKLHSENNFFNSVKTIFMHV